MKIKLLLPILLIISIVGLSACGSTNKSGSASNGKSKSKVVNLMENAEIPTMDSKKGTDGVSFTAQNEVFEGLYYLDDNDQPKPGVAASAPEISKDKKVYTIKLRDNAKWSDGSAVTADDFVYAWRKVADPKTAAEYSVLFDGILLNGTDIINGKKKPEELGVEAVDKNTLKVTLEKPTPYFYSLLTFPTFYPQKEKYVEKQGEKYATSSKNMLYNGPFVMKDWTNTSKSWSYEKNPNYWDKKNIKVDKINLQVVKEPGAAVNLYNTGKLDRANLSGDYAKQKHSDKDYKTALEAFVYYLKFNQKLDGKTTDFQNENLRKAIALSVDKKEIVSTVLGNGSTPINGFVPAKFTFNPKTKEDFRKESGDHLVYNKKEAQSYFEKAKKELGKSTFQIELLGDDQEFSKKMTEYLQNQIENTLKGIKIKIKIVPYKSRLQLDQDQKYQLELTRWGPDYQDPMTFLANQITDNNYNRASYSNKEYDKLLKEASTTLATKPEERWNAMLKAEKVLLDDAGIAPIYQSGTAALQKPTLKGYTTHLFGPPTSYRSIEWSK